MKKLVVLLTIGALAISVSAMSKAPDAKAPADAKVCVVKDACPACTAAGGMCAACKAKADMKKTAGEVKATCGGTCAGTCGCEGKKADKGCTNCGAAVKKAVEEKAGCTGSVCPLKK